MHKAGDSMESSKYLDLKATLRARPTKVGVKEVQGAAVKGSKAKTLLKQSEVQSLFQTEGLAAFQSAAEILG